MRSLTDEQIDFIADDIRIRGVFTQSLQEDLLDHICCFIEEQDDERPFEEIYRRALDAFGQQGLQGIQDERRVAPVAERSHYEPVPGQVGSSSSRAAPRAAGDRATSTLWSRPRPLACAYPGTYIISTRLPSGPSHQQGDFICISVNV